MFNKNKNIINNINFDLVDENTNTNQNKKDIYGLNSLEDAFTSFNMQGQSNTMDFSNNFSSDNDFKNHIPDVKTSNNSFITNNNNSHNNLYDMRNQNFNNINSNVNSNMNSNMSLGMGIGFNPEIKQMNEKVENKMSNNNLDFNIKSRENDNFLLNQNNIKNFEIKEDIKSDDKSIDNDNVLKVRFKDYLENVK